MFSLSLTSKFHIISCRKGFFKSAVLSSVSTFIYWQQWRPTWNYWQREDVRNAQLVVQRILRFFSKNAPHRRHIVHASSWHMLKTKEGHIRIIISTPGLYNYGQWDYYSVSTVNLLTNTKFEKLHHHLHGYPSQTWNHVPSHSQTAVLIIFTIPI